MWKKIIKWSGNILVILSMAFIISVMLKFNIDYSILLKPKVIILIFMLSCISVLPVVFDTIAGKFMIKDMLKVDIPFKSLYAIYSKANIGKYLPGNFMHYVSRGIYCSQYNIKTKDMYYITILEILLKSITAFIITLILVYKQINNIFIEAKLSIQINGFVLTLIIIFFIVSLFIFIFYKQRNIKKSLLIEMMTIKPALSFTIAFVVNSIIFILSIYLIDKIQIYNNILYIIGIYTMAWLIGYVTPGAPGGVGIKETIILVSLSSIFGENIILLAAVITRIINVLGDLFAYLFSLSINRKYID